MNGFGETGQNDHFWAKMAIFGEFWAKMAKTRFFVKKRKWHFRTLIMLQHCAKNQNKPMNGF